MAAASIMPHSTAPGLIPEGEFRVLVTGERVDPSGGKLARELRLTKQVVR